MSWWLTSLIWYFYLLLIGIIFYPLTKKIFFSIFIDAGYPFSKTIGVIFISYFAFFISSLKIISFSRLSLFVYVLFFFFLSYFIISKKSKKKPKNLFFPKLLIVEEILFFLSFFFFVFVRGQEPSIRSLEKFMDFGFINSILRSQYFPPLDMWLAGKFINYYYFGHLSAAVLIKLINVSSAVGYNLILATLFALGITQGFSVCLNLVFHFSSNIKNAVIGGILGSFLINLGGNLHTIYVFTTGYPNENPIPFWKIFSSFNPQTYWYPNATRFIPYTIHEFPSYSYVVADLHGHVFDIPFVLLTLSLIFLILNAKKSFFSQLLIIIFLGFLASIHYMTNAFDGPIYLLLTLIVFFLLFQLTKKFFIAATFYFLSFFIFGLPFSSHFKPFINGIGVNCGYLLFPNLERIGPFLFEKNNCQVSPLWMLFVLWGFFWINFVFFLWFIKDIKKEKEKFNFPLLLFFYATFLILIPEFFYMKDIYPAHFRANTMFKMGYQAFIMMAIASSFVFSFAKQQRKKLASILYFIIFGITFFFVSIYPGFAIPSYYGKMNKTPQLDGSKWLKEFYPEYQEIIDYLNKNVKNQVTILEAQGDSYTDFNLVSSYTGLPTVAGWWVHEWLWRGTPEAVGKLIPEIQTIYETNDENLTKSLIKKFKIKYVIIGPNEKNKYKNLNEEKFYQIGQLVFISSNFQGKIFKF